MRAKDKFLEKINFVIFFFVLSFSHNLYSENIYKKVYNYNDELKNSSAKFIQSSVNQVQEGEIFFGNKRIKIEYKYPQNLTIILSEKKGVYINHDLKETEFFFTKKSYVRVFFEIFHKKNYIRNMTIKNLGHQIEISENFQLDNNSFNIKLIYENDPIKLRRLKITGDDEKIQMGFFDHNKEGVFDKSFFSMIDPYLN